MKHDGGWKTQKSRYLLDTGWFKVREDQVELPTGEDITYTVVVHPGFSMVVPLLDDGRVLLERVYRYTVQETLLECPSGSLDGDSPVQGAHRELEEETGWIANDLTLLGSFFSCDGISDERFHLFLATGLQQTGTLRREPTEQMELVYLHWSKRSSWLSAGASKTLPARLPSSSQDERYWVADSIRAGALFRDAVETALSAKKQLAADQRRRGAETVIEPVEGK